MTEKQEEENGKRFSPVASNEFWDAHALRTDYGGLPRHPFVTLMHERKVPDPRARFAMALIERWGMVTGETDGEDSAGRQRIRLQSVEEVTERACGCATAAFAAFEKRGWLIAMPSYQELVDQVQARENGND